ncbi:MAG: nuclear transport factor 2 family protein [Rhodoluna sp.]
MSQSELVPLVTELLSAYQDKNIVSIAKMFADDVVLRDWNLEVIGKEAAIAEFTKNFNSVKSLQIEVLRVYESSISIAAEIEIVIDGNETLRVVDIVSFNEDRLVTSIISYKGL